MHHNRIRTVISQRLLDGLSSSGPSSRTARDGGRGSRPWMDAGPGSLTAAPAGLWGHRERAAAPARVACALGGGGMAPQGHRVSFLRPQCPIAANRGAHSTGSGDQKDQTWTWAGSAPSPGPGLSQLRCGRPPLGAPSLCPPPPSPRYPVAVSVCPSPAQEDPRPQLRGRPYRSVASAQPAGRPGVKAPGRPLPPGVCPLQPPGLGHRPPSAAPASGCSRGTLPRAGTGAREDPPNLVGTSLRRSVLLCARAGARPRVGTGLRTSTVARGPARATPPPGRDVCVPTCPVSERFCSKSKARRPGTCTPSGSAVGGAGSACGHAGCWGRGPGAQGRVGRGPGAGLAFGETGSRRGLLSGSGRICTVERSSPTGAGRRSPGVRPHKRNFTRPQSEAALPPDARAEGPSCLLQLPGLPASLGCDSITQCRPGSSPDLLPVRVCV